MSEITMSDTDGAAENRGQWSNRWGFILAAAGGAVGLGNIWKFPYITGDNGGGYFVLIYLIFILLIGMPIMVAEVLAVAVPRRALSVHFEPYHVGAARGS